MSSVSKTSGTANSSITVSSKLWFLTYNANESDVFVWKDGVRMKLKNSDSAGRELSVPIVGNAWDLPKSSRYKISVTSAACYITILLLCYIRISGIIRILYTS